MLAKLAVARRRIVVRRGSHGQRSRPFRVRTNAAAGSATNAVSAAMLCTCPDSERACPSGSTGTRPHTSSPADQTPSSTQTAVVPGRCAFAIPASSATEPSESARHITLNSGAAEDEPSLP